MKQKIAVQRYFIYQVDIFNSLVPPARKNSEVLGGYERMFEPFYMTAHEASAAIQEHGEVGQSYLVLPAMLVVEIDEEDENP